jgi:hypothetical protein
MTIAAVWLVDMFSGEPWQTDMASLAVRDLRMAHCERHTAAVIPTAQVTHHFDRAASC